MAVAFTNRGEYERAEECLKKATAKEPENQDLKALRVRIQSEKTQHLEKSREVSKKAFGQKEMVEGREIKRVNWFLAMLQCILVYITKKVTNMVAKLIVPIQEYALSFRVIKVLTTLFITIPLQILAWLYRWVKGTQRQQDRAKNT